MDTQVMMNCEVARRRLCTIVALSIAGGLVSCISANGSDLSEGRPIEFTEPLTPGGASTNGQDFASEKRRLTDLENRLPKPLPLFEFEGSLSGTPAPPAPRYVPVPAKQPKRSGLFVDSDDWALSAPLNNLKDTAPEEAMTDYTSRGNPAKTTENLLNALRRDDWLVNGALMTPLIETPQLADQSPDDFSALPSTQSHPKRSFRSEHEVDLWPRLENLLEAKDRDASVFANRDADGQSVVDADTTGLWRAQRQRSEARSEEYRSLLGLGVNPRPTAPLFNGSANNAPGNNGQLPSLLPTHDFGTSPKPSLQPLMSPSRGPLQPMPPTPPTRATVFDSFEEEQALQSAPPSTVSKPFYEPPKRPY